MCVGLLAGCGLTEQGDAVRTYAQERGKEVADQTLENSVWYMCNAASVGSIKRRYGVSEEKAAAYNELCEQDGPADVITGEDEEVVE